MTKISKRVLEFRERKRGATMRPSTFAAIERRAARSGARDPEAVAGAAYWKTLAARYRGNPYEKTRGLHIEYSAPNQAYFLMWHGAILRIFPTKKEAKAEMEYLLREHNPLGNPRGKTVPQLLDECDRLRKALRGRMNPTYQVVAVRKGGSLGQTIDQKFPTLKAAKEYAKSIDRDVFKKPVVTVSNPDDVELAQAESLYEEFHGREPREILAITESAEQREEYVALGDLVELTIVSPEGGHVVLNFKNDGVKLASSPEGTQLYLIGGNQDISGELEKFGADASKDLVDLGDLKQLVYDAAKWQTDFTPQEWKHDLGEESGIRPRAFFDQLKKRICFAGGSYRVERPGIVD
jgi:hypothetical protein